jgi:hypothetical protein
MSEKQMRQFIMLGLAGAAIYYLFFRSSSAAAFPGSVTITPENPGLIPSFPESVDITPGLMPSQPAQAQPVGFQPDWLTQGSVFSGVPHGNLHGW